mmetsp:Transcript_29836/g.46790  ORF Transcript_29836/g.46790 Transcript_29836/m.46790 type:complete len:102 (+) Transcript_29836:104-409(+)
MLRSPRFSAPLATLAPLDPSDPGIEVLSPSPSGFELIALLVLLAPLPPALIVEALDAKEPDGAPEKWSRLIARVLVDGVGVELSWVIDLFIRRNSALDCLV